MPNLNNLVEKKREKGEWFDRFKRETTKGLIIDFSYEDSNIGKWKIEVKHSEEYNNAGITAPWSNNESKIANQLKKKSMLFQLTENDESSYYVPFGIGYTDGERFRTRRVSDQSELSSEIKSNFEIEKYQQVRSNPSKQFNNKLVYVCKKDDYKKMAFAFILQRIYPVLGK